MQSAWFSSVSPQLTAAVGRSSPQYSDARRRIRPSVVVAGCSGMGSGARSCSRSGQFGWHERSTLSRKNSTTHGDEASRKLPKSDGVRRASVSTRDALPGSRGQNWKERPCAYIAA
eukprot:scaffold143329_cov66-Phaeocystis_antarctica.AAC.4